ncbi:MAG: hypothetical protein RML72_01195 [Bacteroidia bacterium]|nr:hypothetical protein [Bacteroidia bacterium]MDW8157476.1 hypothetical protein [Bacteroidia bacterium]
MSLSPLFYGFIFVVFFSSCSPAENSNSTQEKSKNKLDTAAVTNSEELILPSPGEEDMQKEIEKNLQDIYKEDSLDKDNTEDNLENEEALHPPKSASYHTYITYVTHKTTLH